MNMKPGSLWRLRRDLPEEAVHVFQMKATGERWIGRFVNLGTTDVFLFLGPKTFDDGTSGNLFLVGDMYFWANEANDMPKLELVTK